MTRLIYILPLVLLATPAQARRAVRQAAVIVLDMSGQPPDATRTLQHQVGHELRQRGVNVSRRRIPSRVTTRGRRLRAYARARRIDRIFELRLEPQGDRLLVTLAERGVPGTKTPPRFAARLSAARNQLRQAIASLVQAVLNRTQPQPIQARVAVTVQNAPPTQVGASVEPAATVKTAPPEPLVSHPQKPGEFLWGFSLEPGTYLRTAAGLYGGSAKLYYQLASRPLRLGGEIGGMGGSGRMLSLALRSQYLFPIAGTAIAPLMGVGLGYLMQDDPDGASGAGAAFSASVGAQFSQLTWAHLVAEAEVVLPTFSTIRQDPSNENGIVDIVRRSSWNPVILFKLSCLF